MLHGRGGAAAVVDVDVRDAGARRPPADHHRDSVALQRRRQRIGAVERDEQDPVHVPRGQVALDSLLVGAFLWQEEHELHRLLGQRVADAAQDAGKERVAEDLRARLRDDDGHRVAAARHQAARRAVRHVAELAHGGLDGDAGRLRHALIAVHDAGHGGARDPRDAGDLLERHRSRRPRRRAHRRESALTIIRA